MVACVSELALELQKRLLQPLTRDQASMNGPLVIARGRSNEQPSLPKVPFEVREVDAERTGRTEALARGVAADLACLRRTIVVDENEAVGVESLRDVGETLERTEVEDRSA